MNPELFGRFRFCPLALICIVIQLTVLTSCTKSKPPPDIKSSSLIAHVPANTVGLMYWNTELEGYKKYKKSPWSFSQIPITAFDQPELKKVFEVLNRIGLLNAGSLHVESVKEGIAFLTIDQSAGAKINIGLYAHGELGSDLSEYVHNARSELSKEGIVVKDISNSTRDAISIELSGSLAAYPKEFIITAKGATFAAATEISIIDNFYAPRPANVAAILESPEFKSIQDSSSASFLIAVAQFEKILPALSSAISPPQPGVDLAELPFKAITFRRSFNDSLSDEVRLVFAAKSESEKDVLKLLSNSNGSTLFKHTPDDVLLTLQLDGQTVAKVVRTKETAPPEVLELISMIKRVSLNTRTASIGTLFPELTIILESDSPSDLSQKLNEHIRNAAKTSGMPLSEWKQIEIDGVKVNSSMSPLGIGLYVALVNNFVVITSTEEGIKHFSGKSAASKSLYDQLKSASRENLTDHDSISAGYLNFEKLGDSLKDLQGTLAMFSGGTGDMNQEVVAKLKNLGKMNFSVSFMEQDLLIKSTYLK